MIYQISLDTVQLSDIKNGTFDNTLVFSLLGNLSIAMKTKQLEDQTTWIAKLSLIFLESQKKKGLINIKKTIICRQ